MPKVTRDHTTKRRRNPQETANVFSHITFLYSFDIFERAYRRDLEEEDIYSIVSQYECQKVGDEMEQIWKEIGKKNFTLYRLLLKFCGRRYFILGLIQLAMQAINMFFIPSAMSNLVRYFSKNHHMTKTDAIQNASVVIGVSLLNSFYNQNYRLWISQLGMKVRTGLTSLIYRKCLRLSPSALNKFPTGRIITMTTKDVFEIDLSFSLLNYLWIVPIEMMIGSYMLYINSGSITFISISFAIFLIMIQVIIGRLVSLTTLKAAKKTDERVQLTQEVLTGIRSIKMFTWENYFLKKINKLRKQEAWKIFQLYFLKASTMCFSVSSVELSSFLHLMAYFWFYDDITAGQFYLITSCFQTMANSLEMVLPRGILKMSEIIAAEKRIRDFLLAEESSPSIADKDMRGNPVIRLENASISINNNFFLKHVNLEFCKGLNFVTGPIGSGKSSLIKAILHESVLTSGNLNIQGSISYVPQEPWMFPGTVKENILFGEPYKSVVYEKVLKMCALQFDIDKLPAGDQTIVEDNGMNLSKGQQARMNLARAVYKESDIYLLDDFSSSLDVVVREYIFENCMNDFLRQKLCIMVSHNKIDSSKVVTSITLENGMVTSMSKNPERYKQSQNYENVSKSWSRENSVNNVPCDSMSVIEEKNTDSFLAEKDEVKEDASLLKKSSNIYHENKKKGKVELSIYNDCIKYAGGYGLVALIFLISIITLTNGTIYGMLSGKWADIEDKLHGFRISNETNGGEYSVSRNKRNVIVTFYGMTLGLSIFLLLVKQVSHSVLNMKMTRNIHDAMISRILNAKTQFFDSQFIGNILNRFSEDLAVIDDQIPQTIFLFETRFLNTVAKIILIIYVNPSFLIAVFVLFIVLYFLRRWYIPAGRSLRRLYAATKSPVVGHLNASLEGLTTIRAFNKKEFMTQEFSKHQDIRMSAYHMSQIAMCAFSLSVDLLCVFFTAAVVTFFLIWNSGTSAGSVGLAVKEALTMARALQQWISDWAELENKMTSIERAIEYTKVQTENKTGSRNTNWPALGELTFENVSLSYNSSNKRSLSNLTFKVNPQEKIGIVGRTGAGKSSIVATLFRLYDSEGKIFVNGLDSSTLALDYLRSSISVIPQDPLTFTGTIRDNIDPQGKYTDEKIWKAIESVGLKNLVQDISIPVSSFEAFSIGQKQLLCLARALVQNNSIVVLDEVTANMDEETAVIVQETIQNQFKSCTVLTVAHRLSSVMKSDKIMVIDQGRLVEFDKLERLLEKEDSRFHKMVSQTGLLHD